MTNNIKELTLIELLQKCREEYKNNSNDTFNQLTSSTEVFNKKGTESKGFRLKVNNVALGKMIGGFCNEYGVFRRHKNQETYNGTYDDVVQTYLITFWELINDNTFNPIHETEIYKTLRKTAHDKLKIEIERANIILPVEQTNGYDNSGKIIQKNLIDEQIYHQANKEKTENEEHEYKAKDSPYYIGIFRELRDIVFSTNVKNLLYSNAECKRKLIDILQRDEAFGLKSDDDGRLKTEEKIAELYEKVFGKATSKKEISTFLSETFDTLSNCAVGYKFAKRSDYIRVPKFKPNDWFNENKDKDEKPKKIYKRCINKVHNVLTNDTEERLKKLCGDNETPVEGSGKIFTALSKGIDEIAYILESDSYEVDKDKIREISLYLYDKPEYWNLWERGKNDIKLTYYNSQEGNIYTYRRSKIVKMAEPPEIYIIGNCVIIADENKKLHYLQRENRLFKVSRHEGVYYGYKIDKNLKKYLSKDENDTQVGNFFPLYMRTRDEVSKTNLAG